jgi:hypothetical protein
MLKQRGLMFLVVPPGDACPNDPGNDEDGDRLCGDAEKFAGISQDRYQHEKLFNFHFDTRNFRFIWHLPRDAHRGETP